MRVIITTGNGRTEIGKVLKATIILEFRIESSSSSGTETNGVVGLWTRYIYNLFISLDSGVNDKMYFFRNIDIK